MSKEYNILVTGGYGFIGGNFIRFLKDNFPQHKITNIDKNGYASNPDYIKGLCDENYEIDLARHDNALKELFEENKQFDYIFHFAAESHVDNSISDPTEFIQSNVVGTQNLIENFRKRGGGRFVHISTDEVYGHLDSTEPPFSELDGLQPRSPYSASKAASDLLCLSYVNTYGTDVVVTRCCNNYGPNQHKEKFIPTIINSIIAGKKIPVYGEGMNVREWIHVYDHILGVWAVATKGRKGQIYNIGSGNELSNIELVDIICKKMGKDIDKCVKFVEDRLGHDFRYSICSDKLDKELLFELNYPDFEKEIEEVIEYYETKTR